MSHAPSVRARIAAARPRIARLKRLDRSATAVIVLGGIAVVVSVLGILVFIVAEMSPLFRSGRGARLADVRPVNAAGGAPLAIGVDEYQRNVYWITHDARLVVSRLSDGSVVRQLGLAHLQGASVTAASRSPADDLVAAATSDGRVALAQVRFTPRYEDARLVDLDVEVRDRGLVALDPRKRAVRAVVYREQERRKAVAGVVAGDEIVLWRSDEEGHETRETLRGRPGETFTCLALGGVTSLVAGTNGGRVLHWDLGDAVRLTDVSPVSGVAITALEWILGGNSFVAGDGAGALSGWFRVRLKDDDAEPAMVRAHVFAPLRAPVAAIAPSSREKGFAALGVDGSLDYDYFTNERRVLSMPGDQRAITAALVTPKNDGLLAMRADGTLARFSLDSPHPEITWRSLFGKVWYEGYPEPSYVWQSTGATNAFEAKLSLVPLMFGTLKATFYALVFAIPLAVFGALYTSQFVHPAVKAKIKPTVEIMAALPSVVIGFVAGLLLAGLVERHVVAVLLMLATLPAAGTAGILIWGALPRTLRRRFKPGSEVALIVPMLVLGGWLALEVAPLIETALFRGDFRLWLSEALGLTYDPRNSLVVGIAMGLAVIPIIFTISEDAFSSVPSSLTAASLALGASRWQTAIRVVLPTASPGVFSAIMIGFGRAVGETMIVLMATGNTPVLDWSIFNGMRTLSANIAVEIPEAPYGGTLYRVLFLAAAVLFAMTFAANTIAELIRQRLRERYRAL
jgi:phosphate transport system permease protein